jgi:hypothetical protein
MDMMRPVSVALPPVKPNGLAATPSLSGTNVVVSLSWNDNSIAETAYVVQRTVSGSGTWVDLGTLPSPLAQANTRGTKSFTDTTAQLNTDYQYQIVAQNTVGYGGEFPAMTVKSISDPVTVNTTLIQIAAPTNLTATLQFNPTRTLLSWRDNATNETGFVIERSDNGGPFTQIAARGPRFGTGTTTLTTNSLVPGHTYTYRVAAYQGAALSAWSNTASVTVPAPPAAPSNLTGSAVRITGNFFQDRVTLNWTDNANNETGFQIQRSTSPNFTNATTYNVGANVTTFSQNVSRTFNYYYRVRATNAAGNSAWSNAVFVTTP